MKKGSILIIVLAALFSNLLFADEISGGPRFNLDSGQLTIPCVKVDGPGSKYDGRYFDVKLVHIIMIMNTHSYDHEHPFL